MWSRLYHGRTALVTGASGGFGAAFAEALAERGCRLLLTSHDPAGLERVAAELKRSCGADAATAVADLTGDAGIVALKDAADSLGAPVDILVNNAGFLSLGEWSRCDIEREIRMVRLHVEAAIRLARRHLPGMLARRCGGIVNVASVMGMMPSPHLATYGATKAFLVSWSEALWAETRGGGVRVTAVCPAVSPTGLFTSAGIQLRPDRFDDLPPADVVEAALRGFEDDRCFVAPGLVAKAISYFPRFVTRAYAAKTSARNIGTRLRPIRSADPPGTG